MFLIKNMLYVAGPKVNIIQIFELLLKKILGRMFNTLEVDFSLKIHVSFAIELFNFSYSASKRKYCNLDDFRLLQTFFFI